MTDEDRIVAAELVLELLDDEERSRALARVDEDALFAREVEWWQRSLAPLFEQVDGVSPPPYLRDRIEAQLNVPVLGRTTAAAKWRFVGMGGALGALAASIVAWLLSAPVSMPAAVPPVVVRRASPVLVAALAWTADPARPAPVAIIEPETGVVRLSAMVDVPAGRVAQLWRIPANGKPVPLGLLSSATGTRLVLKNVVVPGAGDQLAISVEPIGGSPTGQPTGPVISSGSLSSA